MAIYLKLNYLIIILKYYSSSKEYAFIHLLNANSI